MKFRYRAFYIYLLSVLFLILFIFFAFNNLIKKPTKIINFIDSNIHENFELEITNNINDISDYLKKYLFIESHLLQREKNKINIYINLKKPFAKNFTTKELIFNNNITAPLNYFSEDFINNIELIDISENSIHINKYMGENYHILSSLFDIYQIEYIDERRYNLVLSNGRIVMLPKMIDSKLISFIKNNIDLINKSTNYRQFLDLRNFHHKTIRLK